jgi:hypothetical protein
MSLKQGIFYDIEPRIYFQDPAPDPSLTQTLVKILLDKSPRHAARKHPRLWTASVEDGGLEKYDRRFAVANAAHAILIGRGREVAEAPFDAFRSKDAKAFLDEQTRAGHTVILADHMPIALAMAKSAREQIEIHEAKDFIQNGQGEVMLLWEEDGVWLRSLVDWLHDDLCLVDDLKTTQGSAAPHAIAGLMADSGWCIQAAMQERGLNALDPANVGRRRFRFGVLEQYPPHALSIAELSEACMTIGRKQLQVGIDIWKRCIRENRFPGYDPRVLVPEYPYYKAAAWEERELTEFDKIKQTFLDASAQVTVLGSG